MKRLKFFVAVASLIGTQCAMGQITKDTIKTPRPNDPMVIHPGHPQDPNAMLTDTGFITKNIIDNVEEIALGKLGVDKGTSPEVKKIAQTLINDHKKILDELKKLALRKQVKLREQPPVPPLPDIAAADGNFDQAWASQLLTLHEKKIQELEEFISITQDLAIKDIAAKALPLIKKHRDMLQKVPGAKAGMTQKTTI